jgi:hypothetical protein
MLDDQAIFEKAIGPFNAGDAGLVMPANRNLCDRPFQPRTQRSRIAASNSNES